MVVRKRMSAKTTTRKAKLKKRMKAKTRKRKSAKGTR